MHIDHLTERELRDYMWLGLGDINALHLDDPLVFPKDSNRNLEIFKLLMNPDYFYYTCKNIFNILLLPFQQVILKILWTYKFPLLVATRGAGKSMMLALYALMRMTFEPGCRIVVVGAGFRQSKFIFDYMTRVWENAPMLRDIAGDNSGTFKNPDQWTFKIGNSECIAIPLGTDGAKIRGLRANYTIADEFSTINVDVYQNVIQGFGVVSADPEINVRQVAEVKYLKDQGILSLGDTLGDHKMGNQSIISGTAFYDFNWFAKYFKDYKTIIKSRGNLDRIRELYKGEIPRNFNWKDFAIIRIPYELIPEGFMDDTTVARAKATTSAAIYSMEYGTVFNKDSEGFFRRTLIESCVTTNGIELASGTVSFPAAIRGISNRQYVIGVDPVSGGTLSEGHDNFGIVVLELHEDHRRIVYCWTITRQKHKELINREEGKNIDDDFYAFCARKIRELMILFPCAAIAMDAMGGGVAVEEALQARKNLRPGEEPIYQIVEEDKPKPTDDKPGLHILNIVNFAKSDWVASANHGLKADMENKRLLFPRYDAVELGLLAIDDARRGRKYDTMEDCILEIEELKTELSTIEHTQTSISGRDRWDTPEVKLSGSKKGRMRKDRYSALLMANAVARSMFFREDVTIPTIGGGFINEYKNTTTDGKFGHGPDWYETALKNANNWYGQCITRDGV